MAKDVQERVAKHGQRMIEVQIRFWTNDIAESKGQIVPKHAWASGVVKVENFQNQLIMMTNLFTYIFNPNWTRLESISIE